MCTLRLFANNFHFRSSTAVLPAAIQLFNQLKPNKSRTGLVVSGLVISEWQLVEDG